MAANPDLINKTALEIHDEVVKALTDANVMVILNNHVMKAIINIFTFIVAYIAKRDYFGTKLESGYNMPLTFIVCKLL